jgi:hypothetical protein
MLTEFVTILVVGILFLQTTCVWQKYLQEIRCSARAIDWPMKSLPNQTRQVASVIDVRVRNENCVQRTGIEWRVLPVALAKFLESLEHSAVNQHLGLVGLD